MNFYISGVFYEACQTYNKVYFERKERENKAEEAFDKISFHVGEGIEFLDATYFLGEIERKVCNFCLREI